MKAIKRVAIIGPQSTGKTWLARDLATHFDTVWVPEYARLYADEKKTPLDKTDVEAIAKGHILAEERAVPKANRYLFVDTDIIMTAVYAELYYGSCPDWIKKVSYEKRYDLYFLTSPDVPWIEDLQRDLPDREAFLKILERELKERSISYTLIRGTWENRKTTAIAAVERLRF